MRLLSLATLYPNAVQPRLGLFVEARLRALLAHCPDVTAHVLAPVPWFPFRHRCFGAYADFARIPEEERRHGIAVSHPRYPVVPKVGMTAQPYGLYRFARPTLDRLWRASGGFDRIEANTFYPDGVAGALLARDFGVPLAITGRGTDLNVVPEHPVARRMIRWAAERADVLVTVSEGLRDRLADLGVSPARVTTVRNGVDLAIFRPADDPAALRTELGLPPPPDHPHGAPVLLFVGNLVPLKRAHLAIEALARLPGAPRLCLAGAGPERVRLEALAARAGVGGRVRFLGSLPQTELARWYAAADLLVLPSEREGLPNVVMEALASGTPVVAARLPGTVEAVPHQDAGTLVERADAGAFAGAIASRLAAPVPRSVVRAHAAAFGWDRTCATLHRLYAGERVRPAA